VKPANSGFASICQISAIATQIDQDASQIVVLLRGVSSALIQVVHPQSDEHAGDDDKQLAGYAERKWDSVIGGHRIQGVALFNDFRILLRDQLADPGSRGARPSDPGPMSLRRQQQFLVRPRFRSP